MWIQQLISAPALDHNNVILNRTQDLQDDVSMHKNSHQQLTDGSP